MKYLIRALIGLLVGISASVMAGEHPMPDLNLKAREAKGEEAIQALGINLDAVARHYGTDPAGLKKLFRNDQSIRIDRKGRIFYAEEAPSAQDYFDQAPSPTADTIPESETLKLHSRPNSVGKIFLNFQGRNVSGTLWNTNGSINATPYSRDSDPAFSSQELRDIREVWLTVAEDFAPFDIDVTTEIPAQMPNSKSIEIMLTNSWEWYGRVGGVCYLNAYTWDGQARLCWVFANLQSIQNVAEATSHEIGHAMGLRHWSYYSSDGGTISSYYWGNSNWAPIMGAAYNARYATWSRGEYTGAGVYGLGVFQDDLAVIAGLTGYAPDLIGNDLSSQAVLSHVLSSGVAQVNHASDISSLLDVDLYRLNVSGGNLNFTISPAAYDANLDFKASILDSNGNEIASSNQDLISSESLSISGIAAGTYFLKIEGVGFGDPYSSGYSAYGSRGRYTVVGSYVPSGSVGPSPTPVPSVTPVPTSTPVPTVTPTATPSPSPDPNPNLAPSSQIISPVSGDAATIGTSVHVSIQSSDDRGLRGAVIYLNGKAKCKFAYSGQTNVASSCSLPVRGKAGVQWRIHSVATDLAGLEGRSQEVLLNVVK